MFRSVWKWLMDHNIIFFLLFCFLLSLWALNSYRSAQLETLNARYKTVSEKLRSATKEAEASRQRVESLVSSFTALQTANDKNIKVVVSNAYKEALSLPDDRVTDSLNELISGARRRNEERSRTTNQQ